MVKRILTTAAVACLVGLAPVSTARATTVCGGTTLQFCVDFVLTQTNTTDHIYELQVTYVSGTGGGTLTGFGIFGTTGAVATGIKAGSSGSWDLDTPGGCTGLGDDACAAATSPPTGNGLFVGQTATLIFDAVNAVTLSNDVFLNAHIQGYGTLSCSIKVGTSATAYTTPGNNGGSYQAGTTTNLANVDQCGGSQTTTPEPASLFLVGTGLAGLAGFIRRRRAA